MVDVGHDKGPNNKSTAYKQLEDQLWDRDGSADYQLTLLEHQKFLQKCYAVKKETIWGYEASLGAGSGCGRCAFRLLRRGT